MNFGLPPKSMEITVDAFKQKKEIEQAAIFGSRARGNFKRGSDIDIVLYGADITQEVLNRVSIELNENLPLPYFFDLVHYESLKHDELKEHIDMFGKVFYTK
jgi:predicted nucleotidyltransferase